MLLCISLYLTAFIINIKIYCVCGVLASSSVGFCLQPSGAKFFAVIIPEELSGIFGIRGTSRLLHVFCPPLVTVQEENKESLNKKPADIYPSH